MNATFSTQGLHLREFTADDLPAFVNILNRNFPDNPRDLDREKYMESIYPQENPRLRYAVENSAGHVIAIASCVHPFWMNVPDTYAVRINVDPDWQRRGLARSILPKLEEYARQQGAHKLRSECREDTAGAIEFLKATGFVNYGLRFESQLDLTTFDESKFNGAIDRAIADGYDFTTLAKERSINPDADRLLYELDELTSQDVPIPGGIRFTATFENFKQQNLEGPEADVNAIMIAKYHGELVGLTIAWFGKNKPAYTAMTGVKREHRQHGLALALKLISFRAIKARGYTAVRTTNDTANPAILRLNEKLGYQKLPGNLLWEKLL